MFRYFFFLIVFIPLVNPISTAVYNCNRTAPCGCSSVASTIVSSRIIGGEIVKDRAWGWIISLQRYGSHICGASLLNSEYAVTAAHCLSGFSDLSKFSILAGTNYLDSRDNIAPQRRNIKSVVLHPDYNDFTQDNDIAIIRFSPLSVNASSTISFICLPSSGKDPFTVGTDLVAIGWGVTSSGSAIVSNSLRQVSLKAIDINSRACRNLGAVNATFQFCAGREEDGKDTCQGDSGGPLMAFVNGQWILAGITSFGYDCALADYPGVYTRVASFIPFIESITEMSKTTQSTVSVSTSSLSMNTTEISSSTTIGTKIETTTLPLKNRGSFSFSFIFVPAFNLLMMYLLR